MNPAFQYVEDGQGWAKWQKDYRFGAFYIFPPDDVREYIDELRQKYDPKSASICQAHLSLSVPLRRPFSEADRDEVVSVLASIEPFELRYGPVTSYPPWPGVAYGISPEEPFNQLRSALHSTAVFRGHEFTRGTIPPHMTIAEFITLERTATLQRELAGRITEGMFTCNAIEYAVPNRQFYFERVLTLPLAYKPL